MRAWSIGLIGLPSPLLCADLWSWGLITWPKRSFLNPFRGLQNGTTKLSCARHGKLNLHQLYCSVVPIYLWFYKCHSLSLADDLKQHHTKTSCITFSYVMFRSKIYVAHVWLVCLSRLSHVSYYFRRTAKVMLSSLLVCLCVWLLVC